MARILALAALVTSLLAPAISQGGTWSGNQYIVELYLHLDVVLVRLTSNPNDGCTNTTYVVLEPTSDPLFKERYSMLLAAKAAGKQVDVLVSGCGISQPAHAKILYLRMNEP